VLTTSRSRHALVLAVGTACAAVLWGCSGSVSIGGSGTISKDDVQTQTATELAQQLNQPTPTVTCPGPLTAKVGATLDCTLVAQGATTTYGVHLMVDSVNGSTAHWSAQVSSAPIGGDKTAFCNDNATLDKAFSGIQNAADFLTALKANQATVDDFDKNTPPDIKADASVLVTAAHTAISANDASGFQAAAVATAGTNVDNYCGQNPDGTPATTAPPTTAAADTTTTA
jgi:hypothetical protein